MKFKAEVDIMPLPALLDPQGKTINASMKNLGLQGIDNVRIGKHITLEVDADNGALAKEEVDNACKRLLVNEIMEFYTIEIRELEPVNV